MRVIWGSDFHLGLKTDDIDRNDEILDIIEDMIDHGIKVNKETGEEVIYVFGGDIFNSNNPNEKLITLFIFILNRLRETGFKSFIMVGNHDEVSDPERVSCLNFVHELGSAYPNITLVDDIRAINMGTFDTGPLFFTFLPHISKALIQRNVSEGKLRRNIPTQAYINKKAEQIMKVVGQGSQHIVFSHLNVSGAHGGSEENLLRKSTVYLPKVMLDAPVGFIEPEIIQAHIHSKDKIGNINIVGSQFYCGFGERESEKYFLDLKINTEISGGPHVFNYIPTNCLQFKQLEVSMLEDNTSFMERDDVLDFLETVDENTVVKLDVTTNVENSLTDWKGVMERIKKEYKPFHIKPIIPRTVMVRKIRSTKQKLGLPVKDAVQVYLKRNIRKDKTRLIRVYQRSLKYL